MTAKDFEQERMQLRQQWAAEAAEKKVRQWNDLQACNTSATCISLKLKRAYMLLEM